MNLSNFGTTSISKPRPLNVSLVTHDYCVFRPVSSSHFIVRCEQTMRSIVTFPEVIIHLLVVKLNASLSLEDHTLRLRKILINVVIVVNCLKT